MTPDNYILYMPPVLLCLVLVQWAGGQNLFSRATLGHLFVGVLWCVTFPLLYSWSYDTPWFISLIRNDLLMGTGFYVLAVSLSALLYAVARQRILSLALSAAFALCDLLFLLIPATQIAYYVTYWHSITPAALMALRLTDPKESIDFLEAMAGWSVVALVALALLLLTCLFYRAHRVHARAVQAAPPTRKKRLVLAVLFLYLASYIPLTIFPQTSIMLNWKEVSDYVEETQKYAATHEERYATLTLDAPDATLPAKRPGTVIVVIGESASRNYMHAYTPDFPYADTPWMEAEDRNPSFTIYRHAYSSWTQTVPALEKALTEASQYNDKEFSSSASILDVAKKAGYKTYWFSNQGRYGEYDSAITLVAKTADVAAWADDSYLFTEKYDERLLDFLDTLDPNENNFVVFHIMGSHIYYNNRYPHEFNRWENPEGGAATNAESYANSILYTDDVLRRIYEYGRERLDLQAMLYFSDHGEDLKISHSPDVFAWTMVRIPFFIYTSPAYDAAFPERSGVIHAHRDTYFTNDMLYDTISGLLNAPSNHYDATQDLTSPSYRFTREDLTTMFGQVRIAEDPAP